MSDFSDAPPGPLRRLLTLEQVQNASGLSPSMVHRCVRSGDLPSLEFGRAIRVTEEDYLAWLDRHRRRKRRRP